jgi:bifunctional non-homologous end joining protein LigD
VPLHEYKKKRRFDKTPEPSGDARPKKRGKGLIYAIQKHRATRLHYDLRLEWNGVLLSWAIPKGPALDTTVKRLARQTEDHPIDYATFEGVIPKGEYGGGTVMLWDIGTWTPESPDVDAALKKGDLKFTVNGKKLHGSWVLVRIKGWDRSGDEGNWLLIKHRDEHVSADDVTLKEPWSVTTGRSMREIAAEGGGEVEKAADADPPATPAATTPSPAPARATGKRTGSRRSVAPPAESAPRGASAARRAARPRKSK